MFKKIVPLQNERHAKLNVKQIDSFFFAADLHVASIMANEFYRAASTYPIVFIEDQTEDAFRPVVLLGLQPQENLFVNAEGRWEATYVPAIIRRYPFALARTDEEGRFTVCIDEESDFFTEEKGEGKPLFDEEGNPGPLLENVKQYLSQLQQMEQLTRQFCSKLKEQNMLAPLNMRVRQADSVKNITGAYAVNDQRMASLNDETFLAWRKENLLPLIYSHLTSLTQIERLVQLRDQSTARQKTVLEDMDEEDAPTLQ